ncbi:MAG TPA: hypothetical protein VI387_12725, partial [Candidatus Brocadiales bacterium]|nr:hypothetical protein [Candidatus Brocadiales bacterium]
MKVFPVRSVRHRWTLLILLALFQLIIIERNACSADIYAGNMYVDTRRFTSRDEKKIGKTLNHPYELSDDTV